MDKYETKKFGSYADANRFSKEVGGYVEGPFFDDKLNREYMVFCKEVEK
jgi:hypothetical protein